ncbi:uncharacterized protein LOC105178251 [Sesamum indicum]|uniref:Uncharacterized protein LOC105178251 n=1 Tax=Sesamum indicum TaxID=4182 RepID=A0A6I9UXT9_SESIN|nr:uncharacterized protein LOC105178251 [Sesamum indicum]
MREYAIQTFCRWMYDTGIPFNTVRTDNIGPTIEALSQFGPGMKPPSYHEVRVTYLKKELEHTRLILKDDDEIQAKYGCTLMANGEKMFELLDKYVQLVWDKNVIQVVTDSASANILAGSLLEAKYPHLYWSPCEAHCIDLMFEDIFKLSNLKKTYERGVMINAYIYNRPPLLDIMRNFTKSTEMVRPTKTHFATAFLTLKRFHVQKGNLRKMFTSEQWTKSRYAREAQGKLVASVILMPSFWNHILYIIKVVGPLVKVLRLVDGERKPPIGYIYDAMDRAKEAIAASFSNNEEKYEDVFALIDARWNVQLHRPLHAAGYYLNSEFFYANSNIEQDTEVMQDLYTCIWRMVPTTELQDKIISELSTYKKAERLFGFPFAIRHRTTKAPSFIKYNRALKRLYDARDTIDHIILDEIDESNEWLLGKLTLDSDEENATVFEMMT